MHVASERTVKKAHELAAELEAALGDIEYRDGVFRIAGTDRLDLAAKQPDSASCSFDSTVADATWPNGCHICEVEIDPDTGAVDVDRYWSVNDVGRVVNPMVVAGQLEGGAAQGIGQALCERVVYDRESGQLLTGSFQDYALPRADMIRHFAMTTDEGTPSTNNHLGCGAWANSARSALRPADRQCVTRARRAAPASALWAAERYRRNVAALASESPPNALTLALSSPSADPAAINAGRDGASTRASRRRRPGRPGARSARRRPATR